MKALSFRQPWADLILQGRKTIDLRTWPTHYRGRLVIHASQQVDRDICALYGLDPSGLVRGALVGTVEVVEMMPLDDERWIALQEQHMKPGSFPGDLLGWRLANPQRLPEPIPMRGHLGLFNIPDELIKDPRAEGQGPVATDRQDSNRPAFKPPPAQPSPYDPAKPFELHVLPGSGGSDYGLALYQWPVTANVPGSAAGPLTNGRSAQPERLADLAGDSLRAVADHVLEALRQNGYKATDLSVTRRVPFRLDEETGLRLGLLFLAVKPLTRLDRIEAISGGLRVMPSEEAYYWFSKCTSSINAANAQRALRILLAGE